MIAETLPRRLSNADTYASGKQGSDMEEHREKYNNRYIPILGKWSADCLEQGLI